MATAKQNDVTWIKKGQTVNGKKVAKGYLALKSAPQKAFSGTVTSVSKGSTTTRGGEAKYVNGRNVFKQAERRSAKVSGGKVSATSSSAYAKPKSKTSSNIGYTAGANGVSSRKKPSAVQTVSASRKAGARSDASSRAGRAASSASSKPAVRKFSDFLGDAVSNFQNRETTADRQLRSIKNSLAAKKRSIKSAEAMRNASDAEKTRQTKLQQEIAALQKQINTLK